MIGDAGQVALPLAVAHLIDADRHQPRQPPLVEPVANDALDDPADRLPVDPQQRRDRRLRHLLREPGDDVLEIARVADGRAGERDRLDPHAAVRAPHPSQLALDEAPLRAEIEVAPAPQPRVTGRAQELAAARTDPPPPTQPDPNDHAARFETDPSHRHSRQPEHPVECRRDAHVALLRKPLIIDNQQPAREGGGASPRPAQIPASSLRP